MHNSGCEELQPLMDHRKRKRMISNRESARRSRMRKQKHLDELMAQVAQLREENNQIISSVNLTTKHLLNTETENSILKAQMAELSYRLQSLNEIINFFNGSRNSGFSTQVPYSVIEAADGLMNNSWNYDYANQPIMASADMLQY